MEDLDVELEDLFKELNIVNMAMQKHNQIDFSTQEGNPGGLLGGFRRWWRGESRKDLCVRMRKLVQKTNKALLDYRQSSYYGMLMEKARAYLISINKMKNYYQEQGDIVTFSDLEASEKRLELALTNVSVADASAPPPPVASYQI